jgi:hypothetical protein
MIEKINPSVFKNVWDIELFGKPLSWVLNDVLIISND